MVLKLWRHDHFDRPFLLTDEDLAVGFSAWLRNPETTCPVNFDAALRAYIRDVLESTPDPIGVALLADRIWPRCEDTFDLFQARVLGTRYLTSLAGRGDVPRPGPSGPAA